MKYFIIACLLMSGCVDQESKDLLNSSYKMKCEKLNAMFTRCDNDEVYCYVRDSLGIACVPKKDPIKMKIPTQENKPSA